MPNEILYPLIFIAFTNLLAFVGMGVDKYNAKHRHFRIEEHTLLCLAVLGGAIGILLGMLIFRHKTKKKRFTIMVPLFLLIEALLYAWYILDFLYGHVDLSTLPAA